MSPPSTGANAGCLPPLNSPNLTKLGSYLTDKNAFLRSYIRSQEAYLASYALEGKAAAPALGSESGGPGTPKRKAALRDFEIESGFGTPVLKYRTRVRPTTPSVVESKKRRDENDTVGASAARKKVKDRSDAPQPVGASAAKSGPPKERRVDINITSKHPLQDVPDKHQVRRHMDKEKEKTSKDVTAAKKRPRESDTDEEHRERLADRRERRRAKKAILAPKPLPPVESDSGEDTDPQKKQRAGKGTKKSKKSKGLNMPAGLALMHGFSATNIGKNRLTVLLDPVVGVFNKGKASAKTTVKKSKPTKPFLKLFSEERFLDKARGRSRDEEADTNHVQGAERSDDDAEELGMADSALEPRRSPHKQRPVIRQASSKRKRPSSNANSDEESEVQRSQADSSQADRMPKRARAESPTWDIELDGGELPSESDAVTSIPSKPETKVDGTVILDTHAATSRWFHAAQEAERRPDQEVLMEDVAPEDHQSQASSIAPSHSASQAAVRRVNPGSFPASTFSKYFSAPAPGPSELVVSYEVPRASSSPAPLKLPRLAPRPEEFSFAATECPTSEDAPDPNYEPLPGGSLAALAQPLVPMDELARASADMLEWDVSPGSPSVGPRSPVPSTSPLGFASGPPSPALSGCRARPGRLDGGSLPLASGDDRRHPFGLKSRQRRRQRNYHPESEADLNPEGLEHGSGDLELPAGDFHGFELGETFCGSQPAFVSDFDDRPDDPEPMLLDIAGDHMAELGGCDYTENLDSYHSYTPGDYLGHSHPVLEPEYLEVGNLVAYEGQPGHEDWVPGEQDDVAHPYPEPMDDPYEAVPCYRWEEAVDEDAYLLGPDDAEPSGDITNERGDFACDPDGFDFDPEADDVATEMDLQEDLGYGSQSDEDRSVLGSLQRFSQGRALLMGVSELGSGNDGRAGASRAEEDVARHLKGHWRRQRF